MSGFDLSTIDLAAGDKPSTLVLRDPRTDTPIRYTDEQGVERTVEIDLLSTESTTGRAKRREFQRARLAKVSRGKRLTVTPEQLEAEKVQLLAALTTSWRGVKWQGEMLECTPANRRMVYSHPAMSWLVEQMEEHVGNVETYLGNGESDSADSPATPSPSASE